MIADRIGPLDAGKIWWLWLVVLAIGIPFFWLANFAEGLLEALALGELGVEQLAANGVVNSVTATARGAWYVLSVALIALFAALARRR